MALRADKQQRFAYATSRADYAVLIFSNSVRLLKMVAEFISTSSEHPLRTV
jgi:hypothetical protein